MAETQHLDHDPSICTWCYTNDDTRFAPDIFTQLYNHDQRIDLGWQWLTHL